MTPPTIEQRVRAQAHLVAVSSYALPLHALTADELRAVLVDNEYWYKKALECNEERKAAERQRDQWRECATAMRQSAPRAQCEDFHHAPKDRHEGHEDCPCLERFIQAHARFDALVKEEKQ